VFRIILCKAIGSSQRSAISNQRSAISGQQLAISDQRSAQAEETFNFQPSNLQPNEELHMTTEMLTLLAGTLLSLGFSYIPGLSDWYGRLGETPDGGDDGGVRKRLVMLALLAVASGGIFALACVERQPHSGIDLGVSCDQAGVVGLLKILVMAVIANQGVYKITPKAGTNAKLARDRQAAALQDRRS
jgi:hypothetical protein